MPQLPAGWEETTLQLCTLPVQEKISLTQVSEDNYISTENMLPNIWWVVISSGLPNINSITKFQKWDILFSNIRTYFRKLWYATFTGGVSNDVLVFRGNYSKIYSKFLFYRLSDNSFFDYTIKTSKWTKMPRWDKEAIWNFPIHLPPLPEQQAIAAVLSSFDDKIELLRAENQTLEQMGQKLFKERFGKWKIGDELPEGWRVGKIEDLTNYIASWGTPATKEASYYGWRINWFSTKELQDCFLFSSEKTITEDALKNSSAKEFPKDTVLMAIYAAPTVWRLWILTQSSAFNQAAVGLVAKDDIWMPFIYLLLKFHRDNFNNLANWAAQQNLNVSLVKNYEIPIPDQETLNQFDLVIKPLFNKIRANSEQIQSLSATRDLLLPKLMSGEVRVEF